MRRSTYQQARLAAGAISLGRNWKKTLWLALGISIPLIIFGFVIWLIIHRGPAH